MTTCQRNVIFDAVTLSTAVLLITGPTGQA